MKIKSLQLKNFKRFTDLTLQGIPGNAKLVLLIGSNGSGKSSVFDGFENFNTFLRHGVNSTIYQFLDINDYYCKDLSKQASVNIYFFENIAISRVIIPNNQIGGDINQLKDKKNIFYGRTGFRQIPVLRKNSFGNNRGFSIEKDMDRSVVFIDKDERLENDLEHIFGKLLREYFVSKDKGEINRQVIDPLNRAFEEIFGTESGTALSIKELIPPLEGKTAEVNFKKGNSTFHYNYLSAGEKEVFNILINLIARKEYYLDTIYYFDEIDLHLNTKLQYNFLKEITENWIPENCQLWTASHSLGFIQYAKENEHAVIFDFDDYDFDYARVLTPEPKDNPEIYEIAVGKEILP